MPTSKVKDPLLVLSRCLGISKSDLLPSQSSIYLRKIRKGQILYSQGDPIDRFFFLIDGYVSFQYSDASGNEVCSFSRDGSLFPLLDLYGNEHYSATCEAVSDVELFFFERPLLHSLVTQHPGVLISLYTKLARVTLLHNKRLLLSSSNRVEDRVLSALVYLAEAIGSRGDDFFRIDIPLTITEIGKFAGITRESTSAEIKKLKKSGQLVYADKIIYIRNDLVEERTARFDDRW